MFWRTCYRPGSGSLPNSGPWPKAKLASEATRVRGKPNVREADPVGDQKSCGFVREPRPSKSGRGLFESRPTLHGELSGFERSISLIISKFEKKAMSAKLTSRALIAALV